MKLSKTQCALAATYRDYPAKRFGDLHERMKLVMKHLEEARGHNTSEPDYEFCELYRELIDAIFELETEVKFYRPAYPPYARRAQPWERRHAIKADSAGALPPALSGDDPWESETGT